MDNQNFGQRIDISELPTIQNGAVYYAALLPLFGMFLENFAVNIWLGIFLWVLVIAAAPLACYRDAVQLERIGVAPPELKRSAWIPVVYIAKRCRALRQNYSPVVIIVIAVLYALGNNGFVASHSMKNSDYIDYVKTSSVVYIPEISDEMSPNTIAEQLSAYMDEIPVYKIERSGSVRTITAEGKADGKKLSIVFTIKNDGFAFSDFKISEITLDGKKLNADERAELIKKIFIEYDAASQDEPQSSSDESYTKA